MSELWKDLLFLRQAVWKLWKRIFLLQEVEHYLEYVGVRGRRMIVERLTYPRYWSQGEIYKQHQAWLRQKYSMNDLYYLPVITHWKYID